VWINQENGGDLIPESLVFPKTALLRLHYEVSGSHARGTSFHFRETQALLDKFFETNKMILPHNIPYSPSNLVEQILCE
jgi:hypothetical protein